MRPNRTTPPYGLIPTRDILDPDVSYSETTLQEKAILAIWIILWISLAGAGVIIVCAMPVQAAEINPSVDTIPFQCRYSFTQWLCDDKAGPVGARGINGTPGTPGAGNFSAIYYNASNFTAYQNTTLIFGNITTGNNTINSNYTVIQGASFYNTTAINESYALLPGRPGGQVLTGGTSANDDLFLNGTSSSTKTTSYVWLQPDGGAVTVGSPMSTAYALNVGGSLYVEQPIRANSSVIILQSGQLVQNPSATSFVQLGSSYLRLDGATFINTYAGGNFSQRITPTGIGIGTTSPTAQLHVTDRVRLQGYPSGTLTTDSGGNLTVVSDEKYKTNIKKYTSGLDAALKVEPISYKFNADSGLDTRNEYVGFSAQNLQVAIPSSVSSNDEKKFVTSRVKNVTDDTEPEVTTTEVVTGKKVLSVSDRAIIATLVNALKEEDAKVQALEARIKILEEKVKP